ncbi:TonB-dependent receptor [Prevotella sp. AM42-24]|uniref:TonB-dependent receptor n=1 Tax=Prevotella sp. AM42-24 TaxID=2293125 RepID=UPI000E492978|nr:TonB-dependent receptor [Prevotella sp. AM42-24]RGH42821.1 TonB-dependent receptor [Prevotella sp. AM42-24]
MKRLPLCILCMMASVVLYAQKHVGSLDSIHSIKEVVVVGNNQPGVIPAQIMGGEELQRLNSLSVADALRFFSGVQLKDYGGVGGIKTINIRSMGTNHVGVFYDGIELANAQNGQVDLGMYSLDNMQTISLYNGQKSQIFQTAKEFASAGSVYLQSRVPEFEEGKTYNMKAKLKLGSFDLVNPSLLMELKVSDHVSASFSGEWLSSSGKYKFRYRRKAVRGDELMYDTTAVRQNGDIRATRMEGALFGQIKGGGWMLKAYNYTSERGVPGAIVNNVWRRGERISDNNSFFQGYIQKRLTPKYQTKLSAKYSYFLTKYVNKDTTVMMIDNVYRQKEFYLSTQHQYDITNFWKVSGAYDFQWNNMDADMYGFVHPTRWNHMLSLATSLAWGGFKMQGSVVYNYVHDVTRDVESPADKNTWMPAVFLYYKPFAEVGFSLRAFYKKSFRMPTFNDLYYAEMGNSKLNPEYTTQYDIGFAYYSKRMKGLLYEWAVQVDGYRNFVSDKIVAYPKGAQFRWTMLNLGKVHINGLDAKMSATFRPVRKLYFTTRLQYTYQQAIDVTNPADTYYRDQIPYIPWHSGSAVVQMDYGTWGLNYSFIYTGERYNQQENIIYNHTQPWYTHDLSVQKSFCWRNYQAKVALEVNNLLSQDYDVILNYPMPKRNYRVTLTFEL